MLLLYVIRLKSINNCGLVGDTKNMEYYAKGIRKFQRELKTSVSEFPRFGRRMPQEFDSENYWPDSSSCAQTQKELEDYRLQELARRSF